MLSNKKRKIFILKVPQCEFPEDTEGADLTSVRNFRPLPSLALAYLGAFIRQYGENDYEIQLEDINISALIETDKAINIASLLGKMKTLIKNTDYDAIGISSVFVNNVKWVQAACKWAKEFNPRKPVILGGGYPTVFPKKSLESTGADYAVIGEGEDTFLNILNSIFNIENKQFDKLFPQISGFVYRKESSFQIVPKTTYIKNPDLIPFPAWDLLNIERYLDKSEQRMVFFFSSRGCPFKCIYCGTYLVWGRGIRFRSAKNVLEEIDWLYNKYGVKNIHFVDDNMTANKKRANTILNGLIERDYPDLTWQASNFAVNSLSKETIELMKPSKMTSVALAVESGSPSIQKKIKKNLNLKKMEEVYHLFEKNGFPIHLNFMIGFPMETKEEMQETIDVAQRLKANETQVNIVTPWPGTELTEYAIKNNNLDKEIDLESLDHRKAVGFINVPWDYKELNHISYDTNIKLNFIDNRDLNNPKNYMKLLNKWKDFELGLPKHAVLKICLGYLYKKLSNPENSNIYYNKAVDLFNEKDVTKAYGKYLEWDHLDVIKDFNTFVENEEAVKK